MQRVILFSTLVSSVIYTSVAMSSSAQVTVNEKDCSHIQKHVAQDDVTYKPGVDVNGKPVVPADLHENRLKLPAKITIDLSLPLADLFVDPLDDLQSAEVQVGKIEFDINSGRMTFNGQVLADPALHAIAEECQKKYNKP